MFLGNLITNCCIGIKAAATQVTSGSDNDRNNAGDGPNSHEQLSQCSG